MAKLIKRKPKRVLTKWRTLRPNEFPIVGDRFNYPGEPDRWHTLSIHLTNYASDYSVKEFQRKHG